MSEFDKSMHLGDEIYESDEDVLNQSSQSYYDEESIFNNFSQGGDDGMRFSNSRPPLGLRLSTTPSFLNLVQRIVSKGKSKTKTNDHLGRNFVYEKAKATNFPASSIKIGNWQRLSRHEGDLTAKVYFAKHKLVWEMLIGASKSKMEINWSDISAIRAIMPKNQPGTLEIELNEPPSYFREVNPQARKPTAWRATPDFTGRQALVWRRHTVSFQPGILDKHYEKLLQCNERLFDMSLKPFPSHPTMFDNSEMTLNFKTPYESSYYQGLQHSFAPPRETPTTLPPADPSMSDMNLGYTNEGGYMNGNSFITHQSQPTLWGEGPSNSNQAYDHHAQYMNYYQLLLDDTENHLLGNQSHVPSSHYDQCTIPADVRSLSKSPDMISHQYQYVGDQMMQDAGNSDPVTGDFYSQQHGNWNMPPQGSSSLSDPYYYNPSSGGSF